MFNIKKNGYRGTSFPPTPKGRGIHDVYIMNGGSTYRNMDLAKILVIIYPCKNIEQRREVVNHEKRHIEDRLLKYLGIDDIEASAYLAGYLSRFIY